ncbi:hypothetical protein [Haladaptatus cibarius]|uniref:hypothetical protein n=1 Tax=Haladaptatus cibarius TaxID=453847 RepID=UPI000679301E|nr:hypothetical protein [Haladaptatus cibarius]
MGIGKSGQTQIDDRGNNLRAGKLFEILEEFTTKLEQRNGADYAKSILNGKTLTGTKIGQNPERFGEKHLIKPSLKALGYEEYRPQPTGIPGIERKAPDFQLDPDREDFVIIGEIKKPNEILSARKESFDYLNEIDRPAAGIATDGFKWILHTTQGEDSRPRYHRQREMERPIKRLRLEYFYDDSGRKNRRQIREDLSHLVKDFEKRAVLSHFK